jgi:hypothetical protein
MTRPSLALLAALAAAPRFLLAAPVPLYISQEGYLLDGDDSPVNGTLQIRFAIHTQHSDDVGADSSVWSETYAVVVTRGHYSVLIGETGKPFDPAALLGGTRWLGVKIGDQELLPRMKIGTTAYAFTAQHALDLECDGAACVGPDDLEDGAVQNDHIASLSGAKVQAATLPWDRLQALSAKYSVANLDAATVGGRAASSFADAQHAHGWDEVGAGQALPLARLPLTDLDGLYLEPSGDTADDLSVGSGGLTVTGATALADLSASGAASLGSLGVTGGTTLGGSLGVTGATTLAGLSASGAATLQNGLQVTGLVRLPAPKAIAITGATAGGAVLSAGAERVSTGVTDEIQLAAATPADFDKGTGASNALTVNNATVTDDGTPKNYTSVTLTNNAVVKVAAWNGTTGGKLQWKVQGTVSIDATSRIDVNGLGYRGGAGSTATTSYGSPGESAAGASAAASSPRANGGGGGAGGFNTRAIGQFGGDFVGGEGGGGSYGAYGTASPANSHYANSGEAGQLYGDAKLTTLHLGAGGGGGGADESASPAGGNGGNGAGAVSIVAERIIVPGKILANGVDGGTGGGDDGGGGGGSGGSILLRARVVDLAQGVVQAAGGLGGPNGWGGGGRGGNGGYGRVRIDADQIVGASEPLAWTTPLRHSTAATWTSAILDAQASGAAGYWETVLWNGRKPSLVSLLARSGQQANLSDAVAWTSAAAALNGQHLGSLASVHAGDRYLQLQATLTRDDDGTTPTLSALVVHVR